MQSHFPFPEKNEHNPYFSKYIQLVSLEKESDLMLKNLHDSLSFFINIPKVKHKHAYDIGKWTIHEVLAHLIDTERVMSYRSLVAARHDTFINIPNFDENHYSKYSEANERAFGDLCDEFEAVRKATIFQFNSYSSTHCNGVAKHGEHNFTAKAGYYIIIGHVLHHIRIIQEKYL